MKAVSRILLFLVLFLYSNIAFSAAPPTCGFTKQCPDGLACVGSIGTTNNGICVLTGPQVALCKTVMYLDGKLVTIFAIFAVVMVGLAFFLGKISWGMIISVILGIAITKGAVTIIKKISGQDEGYCTSDVISYSSLVGEKSGAECVSDITLQLNSIYIYNVKNENIGDLCTTPLTCTKYTCTGDGSNPMIALYLVVNGTYTGYGAQFSDSKFEVFLPTGSAQVTTAPSLAEFGKGSGCRTTTGAACTTSNVSCTQIVKPAIDYFYCQNSCTKSNFAVYYDKGKYKNCAEVASAS